MMFRLVSLLIVASAFAATGVHAACQTIAARACSTDGYEIFCAAIKQAKYYNALNGSQNFTVFAPTDQAFKNVLGDDAGKKILKMHIDVLKEVLQYHAVQGQTLFAGALKKRCGQLLTMFNGRDTRTYCSNGKSELFQKGAGNSDLPKITIPDVQVCNGVAHVVDEVILPKNFAPDNGGDDEDDDDHPPDEDKCETITDIICNDYDFDYLCQALQRARLDDDLSYGEWTVFAPTDSAFHSLLGRNPSQAIKDLTRSTLKNLLRNHLVANREVDSNRLICNERLGMANGQKTWTVCRSGGRKYQYGWDNYDGRAGKPKIITKDVEACNGIIHVVDDVILTKGSGYL